MLFFLIDNLVNNHYENVLVCFLTLILLLLPSTNPEFIAKVLKLPQEQMRMANILFGWLSPLNHATYYMHNFGYDNLPKLWVSYLFFILGSLVLLWLSFKKMKNYTFEFTGTGK